MICLYNGLFITIRSQKHWFQHGSIWWTDVCSEDSILLWCYAMLICNSYWPLEGMFAFIFGAMQSLRTHVYSVTLAASIVYSPKQHFPNINIMTPELKYGWMPHKRITYHSHVSYDIFCKLLLMYTELQVLSYCSFCAFVGADSL